MFKQRVLEVVRNIPPGKVMSYGQVAAYVGLPRAARQVGWILRQLHENDVPWHRVINQKGVISISDNFNADRDLQKKLLEAEGITVNDFQLDMGKYRFVPSEKLLKKLKLSDSHIQTLIEKYSL